MARRKEKWIPRHMDRGALTRKAKAAGMTLYQYLRNPPGGYEQLSTRTKRQINLAKTFRGPSWRRKGRRKRRS